MKSILPFVTSFFLAAGAAPVPAACQTPGDFQRIAGLFRQYYNAGQSDSLFALFAPEVKKALPLDKTHDMITALHAQLGNWNTLDLTRQMKQYALFKAGFEHSVVTLSLALDDNAGINGFHFLPYKEDTSAASAVHEGEPLSLHTGTSTIFGSLIMPASGAGGEKPPLVLIIAGSGPTDRDGNAPTVGLHSDMYKLLADSLARHGIASLRYDKRGIGASTAAMRSESDMTIDDYIADAAGWIRLLQKDPRFSKIVVLGHSEGSLVGMVAAREAHADAYISASGAGDRIDKVVLRQIAAQSPGLVDTARILFDSLSKSLPVHVTDGLLQAFFRPSIQPYMISWLKYDPRTEIRDLAIPVLILQGTTDLQVTVGDAEKLKEARPSATLRIISGMNHIFRDVSADRDKNIATYSDPSLPLDPTLVRDIVTFITN